MKTVRELMKQATKILTPKAYLGIILVSYIALTIGGISNGFFKVFSFLCGFFSDLGIVMSLVLIATILYMAATVVNLIMNFFVVKFGLNFVRTGKIMDNIKPSLLFAINPKNFLVFYGVNLLVGLIIMLYMAIFLLMGGGIVVFIGLNYHAMPAWGSIGLLITAVCLIFCGTVYGTIVAYRYRQAALIACEEDKKLPVMEILKRSKAMMDGNKWRLFKLDITYCAILLLIMILCGSIVGFALYMKSWVTGLIAALVVLVLIIVFVLFLIQAGVANICFYQDLKENYSTDSESEISYLQPKYSYGLLWFILLFTAFLGGVANSLPIAMEAVFGADESVIECSDEYDSECDDEEF